MSANRSRVRAGRHSLERRKLPVGRDRRKGEPGKGARPPAGIRIRVEVGEGRDRLLAELGVIVAVLIWSSNFVVVKAAIAVIPPLTFAALRYLVASVTLLLLLRAREGRVAWPAGQGAVLLILGAIGFGGYQVLWTLGLTQTTAGDSALLVAASPVLTALLAGAVGIDRLTGPKLIGASIAFVGVALIVAAGGDLAIGATLAGDAATLGAAALWAVYTIGGARVLRGVGPLAATAWTVVAGTLVLAPFGIAQAVSAPSIDIGLPVIAGTVYSGAFAAGISNVFVLNAIRLTGPTRVAATQFLVPAGAVVLGALLLGEAIGPAQVIGGAVIVLGVGLTRRASLVPVRVRARLSSNP